MQEKLRAMPKEFQPATPEGPDRKWRYMWRVGPRPSDTRFQDLLTPKKAGKHLWSTRFSFSVQRAMRVPSALEYLSQLGK